MKLPFKNMIENKAARIGVFVIVMLSVSYYYNYHEIINYRPTSVHQWRNSISASIALNYYHHGEFLHPRTHNLQADDYSTDITITEFPVLYYAIGMLYKVFGYHEFIYKLINVLIGFAGLFFVYLLGLKLFRKMIYAIFLPLLIFTSPIYVYYTNNFIPDATSLSVALIGLYFFYRHYETSGRRDFLISMAFFCFAGLLKTPALLLFFAIGGLFVLERIFGVRIHSERRIFKSWGLYIAGFSSVLLLILAWYTYAKIYTDIHGGVVSPVELRPIWKLSMGYINDIWEAIKRRFWSGNYHAVALLLLSFVLFIHNLIKWKHYNRMLSWLTLLSLLGGFSFTLLFFRSMKQHDYYQMNNLVIILLIQTNFILYLKNRYSQLYHSWITRSLFAVFAFYMVITCGRYVQKTYYSGWFYNYYQENYNQRYDDITPYLRSLGIDREDPVYVTWDPSINISLYLMDQKGHTDFHRKDRTFSESVEFFRGKGLEYVIVGDYDKVDVTPDELGLQKIGTRNGVDIFQVPEN